MTHTYNIIQDERNLQTIERRWDSAIEFSRKSNTYALFNALTTALNDTDEVLENVYSAQHIDSAHGTNLDKLSDLVNVQRRADSDSYGTIKYGEDPYGTEFALENDDLYRARIKANFRASTSGTTFDEFVEFVVSVLDTSDDNIEFTTNYDAEPATITTAVFFPITEETDFTAGQISDLLNKGVPAGHEVNLIEGGTFRLKEDGDVDDPDAGLTADGIETGGTLANDP